jgi:hypothetical protein
MRLRYAMYILSFVMAYAGMAAGMIVVNLLMSS